MMTTIDQQEGGEPCEYDDACHVYLCYKKGSECRAMVMNGIYIMLRACEQHRGYINRLKDDIEKKRNDNQV